MVSEGIGKKAEYENQTESGNRMIQEASGEAGIYMRTLGGFSLSYNGKMLSGGAKSGESQFACLMQLLLHNLLKGEEGVGRDVLEQTLFGDRDIEDIRHAVRSVVYNARRRLEAAGLPGAECIGQKKGAYCWTGPVMVREDAAAFEKACRKADRAQGEERLELYMEACRRYTGEFLPGQAGVLWVAQEARRYRAMFCSCVEKAAALLRARKDFLRMEKLGIHAAGVSPLADWEAVTMEALVSLGRHEEARKFYDDTVEFYLKEQGLHPSEKLTELSEKLGRQFGCRYNALEDIRGELSEGNEIFGGYLCSYPVFQGVYRMVERMMERGGQSVYLMLCMVVDGKGNPVTEGNAALDELSGRLEEAVRESVRHSDAITGYGKGRYLVLLVNTSRENCAIIQKRISKRFMIGRQRMGIKYYLENVECGRKFRVPG